MKKTILFSLLFIAIITKLNASHIIGGDITYNCLGNNQYEITLTLYRDCSSATPFEGTTFSGSIYKGDIGIFNMQNNLIDSIEILNPPIISSITTILTPTCLTISSPPCVEQGVYTFTKTLPPIPGGYYITFTRCCRNAGTLNLINPGSAGTAILTHISDTTMVKCNSTPHFTSFPPIALCMNDSFSISSAATDNDGDSLVYSICDPLSFTSNPPGRILSSPPSAPPYTAATWAIGCNSFAPFGPYGDIFIDANTGVLTGITNAIGRFVVCVGVSEYRNGTKIGFYQRDFQLNTMACTKIPDVTKKYAICPNDSITLVSIASSSKNQWYDPSVTPIGSNDSLFVQNPKPGQVYIDSIVDSNGCQSRYTHSFTEAILFLKTDSTYLSDATASDGSASVVVSGGSILNPGYQYLWLPGNETTNQITGLSAGSYTVIVTSGGCISSKIVHITTKNTIGINTISSASPIVEIFPNPFSKESELLFKFKNIQKETQVTVIIKDVLGKHLFSTKLNIEPTNNTKKLEGISNFNSGVYVVEIKYNDQTFSKKIIVK